MTRRRWTTDEELEAEREQDERDAKGCLRSLGCAGDGCPIGAIPASSIPPLIRVLV